MDIFVVIIYSVNFSDGYEFQSGAWVAADCPRCPNDDLNTIPSVGEMTTLICVNKVGREVDNSLCTGIVRPEEYRNCPVCTSTINNQTTRFVHFPVIFFKF